MDFEERLAELIDLFSKDVQTLVEEMDNVLQIQNDPMEEVTTPSD